MSLSIRPPVSDYAPKRAGDPLLIGKITVAAVDQIGATAAEEIEQAAAQVRDGAETVAACLEKLAQAIRGHSKIASEHTAAFIAKTTQVLETVRALDAKLENHGANGETEEETQEATTNVQDGGDRDRQ